MQKAGTESGREGAGQAQAWSAMDPTQNSSDYAGFSEGLGCGKIREGGLGSIMRDPDMDPSLQPEKAQVSRMIFKNNSWKTVDKVNVCAFVKRWQVSAPDSSH
ncbi:hypothetical protein COOONC_12420 [Cooperia oncophora]